MTKHMMSAVVSRLCGGVLIAGGILCWLVACGGDSANGPPVVHSAEVCKVATDCKTEPDALCKDVKTIARFETPSCADGRCMWIGTEERCGLECHDGFCVSAR